MGSLMVAAALVLSLSQVSSQPYTGTWTADLAGKTFVRLELSDRNGTLAGKIALGDIQVDSQGEVSQAASAPRELTPLSDITLRDSTLSFSRKDGTDTDHFEMRLLANESAELRFVISDADRQELATNGIAMPKPVRLKRVSH